ncbi:hypothetical protein Anapl_03511 [Anas platyrhynchos]|uniref:Uncharacterized protein n=1 Tax=Anas platyrhynchos TaxID=8839 RepID=R0K5S4_ANAPL|nr:hypothetical protein Anapl_03511 [Anas platyrhynchos]
MRAPLAAVAAAARWLLRRTRASDVGARSRALSIPGTRGMAVTAQYCWDLLLLSPSHTRRVQQGQTRRGKAPSPPSVRFSGFHRHTDVITSSCRKTCLGNSCAQEHFAPTLDKYSWPAEKVQRREESDLYYRSKSLSLESSRPPPPCGNHHRPVPWRPPRACAWPASQLGCRWAFSDVEHSGMSSLCGRVCLQSAARAPSCIHQEPGEGGSPGGARAKLRCLPAALETEPFMPFLAAKLHVAPRVKPSSSSLGEQLLHMTILSKPESGRQPLASPEERTASATAHLGKNSVNLVGTSAFQPTTHQELEGPAPPPFCTPQMELLHSKGKWYMKDMYCGLPPGLHCLVCLAETWLALWALRRYGEDKQKVRECGYPKTSNLIDVVEGAVKSFLMELQMLDFRILCFWFLVVITKCGSQEGKILHSKWLYFVIKGINVCYKGHMTYFQCKTCGSPAVIWYSLIIVCWLLCSFKLLSHVNIHETD